MFRDCGISWISLLIFLHLSYLDLHSNAAQNYKYAFGPRRVLTYSVKQ